MTDSSLKRLGLRKISTQTEVSTSSTTTPARPARRRERPPIAAHLAQLTLPQTCARKVEDPACLDAPHEVVQRPFDGSRVGPLPAQTKRFGQELLIKHKIYTFHVYKVLRRA